METNTKALMKQVTDQADSMVQWSDEKRKEFAGTFDARVRAAQYILIKAAEEVYQKATSRQFLSKKHARKVFGADQYGYFHRNDVSHLYDKERNNYNYVIGGRSLNDLNEIAAEQAKEIMKTLPPLKKAVEIISPEVSQMLISKEKLEKTGQKYLDQLDEISGDIDLDDLDQSMTLKAFRDFVKGREKKRKALVTKLNEIGEEVSELDEKIAKHLYKGIPGLSDAIVDAINTCTDKSKALSEMSRRVTEKVMFGDSEAAMSILRNFEKDEAKVSDDVRQQLLGAVEALKLKAAPKKKGAAK